MRRNLIRFLLLTIAWLGSIPLLGDSVGRSMDDRCWLIDTSSNNHFGTADSRISPIQCPSLIPATLALADQFRSRWSDSLTQKRDQFSCQFQELSSRWPTISWATAPASSLTPKPPIDEYWAYYQACDDWNVSWGAILAECQNPSHFGSQLPPKPMPQVSLIVLKPISGFRPQTKLLMAFAHDSITAVQSQVRNVWQAVQFFGYQCQYYRLRGECLAANFADDLQSASPQFVASPINHQPHSAFKLPAEFWQPASEWLQGLQLQHVISAINDVWAEKSAAWLEQLDRYQQAMEWLHLQHLLQGM